MKYSFFIFLFSIIISTFSQTQNCVKKLSQDQINAILDAHNTYRNIVASGNQSSAGGQLPSASNMKALEWSTELEEIAQGWANTNPISYNPNLRVSNSSSPMKNSPIGGNMYWTRNLLSKKQEPGNFSAQNAVSAWFREVKDFEQPIEKFRKLAPNIWHFTQVIWAETTKIGCGILDCASSENYLYINMYTQTTTIVCSYWSVGNIAYFPIYKKGVPCSNCTCSKKYTSLCI